MEVYNCIFNINKTILIVFMKYYRDVEVYSIIGHLMDILSQWCNRL